MMEIEVLNQMFYIISEGESFAYGFCFVMLGVVFTIMIYSILDSLKARIEFRKKLSDKEYRAVREHSRL